MPARLPGTYRESILSGNYHNGPLSIVIPFGIWGLAASYGSSLPPYATSTGITGAARPLQTVNTFILAYFIARVAFFFLVYAA